MLFDLLQFDLGDWHPREIVRTAALAEQHYKASRRSTSGGSKSSTPACWSAAGPASRTGGLQSLRGRNRRQGRLGSTRIRIRRREGLFDAARASSPRLRGISDHVLGHYLTDKGGERARVSRRRGWEFKSLADCGTNGSRISRTPNGTIRGHPSGRPSRRNEDRPLCLLPKSEGTQKHTENSEEKQGYAPCVSCVPSEGQSHKFRWRGQSFSDQERGVTLFIILSL